MSDGAADVIGHEKPQITYGLYSGSTATGGAEGDLEKRRGSSPRPVEFEVEITSSSQASSSQHASSPASSPWTALSH